MKFCGKCKETKSLQDFCKNKTKKDGLADWCKSCNKTYHKVYNKTYNVTEDQKQYRRDYNKTKKAKAAQKLRRKTTTYRDNQKRYRQSINGRAVKKAEWARRHATKLQRTPSWLTQFDLDYMKSIYLQATELEKIDGIKRHVDHLIPLQGDEVSGLHVPYNLQILTEEENLKKSNKLLPEYING